MFKFFIICVVLLNGKRVLGDDCLAPGTAGKWMILFAGACCNLPNLTFTTNNVEVCAKELKLEESNESAPINNTEDCLAIECILTKPKLIVDGKISLPEVTKVVGELFKASPSWIPLVNQIVEKCVKEAGPKEAEIKKKASEAPYNIKGCNPMYGYYLTCISVELDLQCPSADMVKAPECDKDREFLKKCPDQYFSMLSKSP